MLRAAEPIRTRPSSHGCRDPPSAPRPCWTWHLRQCIWCTGFDGDFSWVNSGRARWTRPSGARGRRLSAARPLLRGLGFCIDAQVRHPPVSRRRRPAADQPSFGTPLICRREWPGHIHERHRAHPPSRARPSPIRRLAGLCQWPTDWTGRPGRADLWANGTEGARGSTGAHGFERRLAAAIFAADAAGYSRLVRACRGRRARDPGRPPRDHGPADCRGWRADRQHGGRQRIALAPQLDQEPTVDVEPKVLGRNVIAPQDDGLGGSPTSPMTTNSMEADASLSRHRRLVADCRRVQVLSAGPASRRSRSRICVRTASRRSGRTIGSGYRPSRQSLPPSTHAGRSGNGRTAEGLR